MEWQIKDCILKISTGKKVCDGCLDRHYTCPKCKGPMFREGSYGYEGVSCYHCDFWFNDSEGDYRVYIEKRLNVILEEKGADFTISELLKGTDALIFGGAIRDILSGVEVNDIDIICFSKSKNILVKFLENKKFEYKEMESLDFLYHSIKIFSNPLTFYNTSGLKIQIINLCPPAILSGKDSREKYFEHQVDIIGKVDISICGVYWSPSTGLKEACKGALEDIKNREFRVLKDNIMHQPDRIKERILKMKQKGFIQSVYEKEL